jgi:hypothetical protein
VQAGLELAAGVPPNALITGYWVTLLRGVGGGNGLWCGVVCVGRALSEAARWLWLVEDVLGMVGEAPEG